MLTMGKWEWLIIGFLAIAVAWRFWPKRWRFTPSVRFSVRWLMVAVLVVGLISGGFARWYARQARHKSLIAELHVQQQVTNSAIHAMHTDLAAAGRKNSSFLTGSSFDLDQWTEQLDAYEGQDNQKMPLIFVEVSGGCEDDVLRPITIKTTGAPMEGPLLDRLIRDYRARGWQHRVVPVPAAAK